MGSGGVGGYFGGRLALGGEEVTFVARGDHLRAMKSHGLTLRGPSGDLNIKARAVGIAAEAELTDLVLFTVKSYDTESVAAQIKPCLGTDTVVLTLQNGIGNAERIGELVGIDHVMAGAGYIVASIESPGVIKHATAGRIAFGELDGSDSARGRAIHAAFEKAGFRSEFSLNIRKLLWEKFALICGQGMTASTRLGIGQIRTCPESRQMLRLAYEEVTALAAASGAVMNEGVVDWLMKVTDALPPESRTSLAHDLSAGKRLEVEALQGNVVRLGQRYGLPTPMNFAIYAHLKPYDMITRHSG